MVDQFHTALQWRILGAVCTYPPPPMNPLPREQVVAALAEILREFLAEGEPVTIPGLGTFAIMHEESRIEEQPDGQYRMVPPHDQVTFEPESFL